MGLRHEFKETPNSLELIYRWYEPYHKVGCLFFFVWDFFGIALYHPELLLLLKGDFAFPRNIFALLIFIMMIPIPTYWMVVCVMNRTVVHLNDSEVIVRHGPLPWWRKDFVFALDEINYIWIEDHSPDSVEYGCRDLVVKMKNGEARKLFLNMQDPEETRVAHSRISLWLRKMRCSEISQIG